MNIDDTEIYTIMEESNAIERDYHAFFDITIVNDDIGRSFARLAISSFLKILTKIFNEFLF